ncbi:MAG: sigma-54-dependent transcriptional regulator, partial [Nevskiaceae bacterium]
MDAKRILLVDDDAKLSRVLALRLESEGYDVVAAASGEEALERLVEARPGFVLADLRMPGMDGIELLARIQERYPGLPVALISAQGDIPDAVRATHAGAVDFLTKPVDRDRLLDCVRRHLGGDGAESNGDAFAADFVTRSAPVQAVIEDARRVAKTDAAVLI